MSSTLQSESMPKLLTPFAIDSSPSPSPSGTVTPFHFLTESANCPNDVDIGDMERPPSKDHVKAFTPSARVPIFSPRPSGISTSAHFLTESAKTPRGSAIALIENAPNPERVFKRPPRAVSAKAPPIAVRPLPISSQSIDPNSCKALAISIRP